MNNTSNQTLEKVALVFGVVAIGSTMIIPVFCPLFFGSIAIVMAFLSKGYDIRMATHAKIGAALASVAIVLNIALLVGSVMLYLYVPAYKQQINQVYEQMYGEPLEDFGNMEAPATPAEPAGKEFAQ